MLVMGTYPVSKARSGPHSRESYGAASAERIALSDQICDALQLVEHLQDVGEDFARGRVYLPREDMARFGCAEHDLAASTVGPALRELLAFEASRARTLLDRGAPLAKSLAPRPRLAVGGFVAGGRAALDALDHARYEVLGARPRPTRLAFARRWVQAVTGR